MIRRTLNIPVFAATVVGLVVAASGFHIVRQWQLSRLSQTFRQRAKAAEDQQQWLAAADLLDRYLRFEPQHAAVRQDLAVVYAKGARSLAEKQRATALHYRALAAGSGDSAEPLRSALADLLLQTGRLLEAESEAQEILRKRPDDAQASRVFALARYLQWRGGAMGSKTPEDLQLLGNLEQARKLNPADIALAEITATLYREHPEHVAVHLERRTPEQCAKLADTVLDQAVEQNPSSAEALLARHLYRVKFGDSKAARDLAAKDLAQALALDADNPQVLLVASEALYQQAREALADPATPESASAQLEDCEKLLSTLIQKKLAPDNPQPHLRLGDVHVLNDDLDRAIGVWQEGLAAFNKPTVRVSFQARIGDHLLKAGRIAEAQPALAAIEEILADLGGTIRREDHLALMQSQGLRQATSQICLGRYSEAVGELQRAIARQPQLQPDLPTYYAAWELLGRAFSGLQDWAAAATAFDRAANFLPEETGARLAAAEAWLTAGRTELAVDRAEQVLEQARRPDAKVPHVPAAWLVLATAELHAQAARPPAERRWDSLQRALNELNKLPYSSLAAPWRIDFLHADYLALSSADETAASAEQVAAAEVLRRAESKYQDRPEFWFQACLAYERLAQPQDAQRAWQQLNQLPGAQTEAAIAASRRAAAREDYNQAASILQTAAANLPSAAQDRLRQELIRLAQAKQDLRQLEILLRGTLRERPHDVGALCGLAELSLRSGDFAALEQWERQLAAAGPPGDVWSQYFRITRLNSSAAGPHDPRLTEALAEQARLATVRPSWADTFTLRGAIEQRRENFEAAAAAYEQAVELGERRCTVFEQLIACLDRLERPGDVEKYLARMESYLPASQRLTELASVRQLDENRPEQAIDIARRAIARRPNDLNALLWLGRLLLATNQLPQAREIFDRATKTSPTDARGWHGLFTCHLRSGHREQAQAVLESLRQHARLSPESLARVLAAAYAQLGDRTQALELLHEAVQLNPKSAAGHLQLAQLLAETDRDLAKVHLQAALQLDSQLVQARWLLATLLAASGSEEDLIEAERLLDEAGGGESTIEDRRVRAILLAQHFGDHGLARAIMILEQLVAGNADSTTDRLLLAQFYERRAAATTDADQASQLIASAREQLLRIADRPRATMADVGVLIGFLLRHSQKPEAARWLDRLEERIRGLTKPDPKAIALLIDLRLQQGSVKQVEPWLAKLDAADRDPFRPLIARVKYFAAVPNVEAIAPAVEGQASRLMSAAKSLKEQSRIARQIGDLYLLVNQLAGAEKWYRTLLRSDPEQFEFLATALVRQGRAREAIRLCETATQNDTTSRPAVILTSLLLETGAKPEYMQIAEPLLAAALEKFPEDVNLLYGVGMLRVLEDRYPDAVVLLRKVIRLNPRHVPALNNLAMLLAEAEDTRAEGLALVERAISHRGHQPTLLDTKGTILLWSGRTQDAVDLLEAAARGSTTDPRHSFHLALAYHELGATGHAFEQLASATQRKLELQILTPTDRKAFRKLQAALTSSSPEGEER